MNSNRRAAVINLVSQIITAIMAALGGFFGGSHS